MSLLGLDIGTSGCKATIVDERGIVLGKAYQAYPLLTPRPGWEELNPETVWDSVQVVIMRALSSAGGSIVRAISVSSFGEAVVPIDRQGCSLYNSIIYIDSRGAEEAAWLESRLGAERIHAITGAVVHPMYSLCKILWLKCHEPEIYAKTWKFLLFADFILFRLGARPHTDYSLAARTMAFDVINKEWSSEILDCAEVDKGKFGDPIQSGCDVGRIDAEVASKLGLPKDIMLVSGGHDQPCAALGAGVLAPGSAVDGMGTTECITPAFDHPIISPGTAASGFACVPHVKAGMYVTYAFTFTSGSLLKWYLDNFGTDIRKHAKDAGVSEYEQMISEASPGPAELFILPHFAGAATPYMDTKAKGAIVGLTINTSASEMIRGVLEGITFEMMVNVERLDRAGIRVDELRVVGGLARYPSFLQLKADMMGRKVTTLAVSEAGTVGVAILAGTACGIYRTLEEGVSSLVRTTHEYHPNADLHAFYMDRFEQYKRIYPAVRGIF